MPTAGLSFRWIRKTHSGIEVILGGKGGKNSHHSSSQLASKHSFSSEKGGSGVVRSCRNERGRRKDIWLFLHKQPIPLAPGCGSRCCEENINGFNIPLFVPWNQLSDILSSLAFKAAPAQKTMADVKGTLAGMLSTESPLGGPSGLYGVFTHISNLYLHPGPLLDKGYIPKCAGAAVLILGLNKNKFFYFF